MRSMPTTARVGLSCTATRTRATRWAVRQHWPSRTSWRAAYPCNGQGKCQMAHAGNDKSVRAASIRRRDPPYRPHPCLELVADPQTKKPFAASKRTGYAIYKRALQYGLILRPLGDVLYFNPPLNITREELTQAIEITHEAMACVLGPAVECMRRYSKVRIDSSCPRLLY